MPGFLHQAVNAYKKIALETATPRQLEAQLLLKAASHLQRALDRWPDKASGLREAALYNSRLWNIFIDAVSSEDNALPIPVRQNLLNLGVFVMAETYSLMTGPKPEHLANLVSINRRIAAGLEGKSEKASAQAAQPAYGGDQSLLTAINSRSQQLVRSGYPPLGLGER